MRNRRIRIKMSDSWYKRGDLVEYDGAIFKVVSTPDKKWYKILFYYLSFKLYTIPDYYTLKIM